MLQALPTLAQGLSEELDWGEIHDFQEVMPTGGLEMLPRSWQWARLSPKCAEMQQAGQGG